MTQFGRMASSILTASAFNQLGQYTCSPGRTGYCYAVLPVFFHIGGRNQRQYSTHFAYPRRDGQAELAWVAGYVVRQFTCLKAVTHPSTNGAKCRATALIETDALPLHQTAPAMLPSQGARGAYSRACTQYENQQRNVAW